MLAKRDLGVILLALLGVYFSLQNEGVVSFNRAWHVPGDAIDDDADFLDPISHRPKDAHAPRPVFFDLNGDGRNEVIVASSSEPEIRIASPPAGKKDLGRSAAPRVSDGDSRLAGSGSRTPRDDDEEYAWRDGWIPARTVASASLMPSNVRVAAGRRAVALAAGHIDPPVAKDATVKKTNKGVVVVVTESFHVLCFDHNLKLMWENSLQEQFPRHARVREVAVLVSNATMFKGDRGSIVVGGRVELGDLEDEYEDPLAEELDHEDMMMGHRGGRRVATDTLDAEEVGGARGVKNGGAVDRSRHFNYYAFDGASGNLRWKHESDDFHRNLDDLADKLTPQHNYRLTAQSALGHHYGEVACRDFRESVVVNALPHVWREREDTRLRLAHFRHHRTAKGAASSKVGTGRGAGVPSGGAEGAEHSNPIARAIAGTVNRAWRGSSPPTGPDRKGGRGHSPDGQIGAKHRGKPPNVIVAHQEEGIEVIHLYSGKTLCKMAMPPGGLHADINGDGVVDHVQAHGGGGSDPGGHPVVGADGKPAPSCWAQATSGVPVREHLFGGSVCRGSAGVVRHGSGHFKGEPSGGYTSNHAAEVVAPALLRRGEEKIVRSLRRAVKDVVFLNSRGDVTCYGHDGMRRWQQRTDASWQPGSKSAASLTAFPLRVGGAVEVVLAAGATHAVLLTPSGYKMNSFKLPKAPVAALTVADVDGDGLNDVVARTEGGDIYAWRQRSHPGLAPFTFLLGALALAVAAAFVTQMPTADEMGRIVRSTDVDEHESAKDR